MMHMTFYWSRSVTLLFDSWKTDTWFSYALTLLACFLFSAFYQYLEHKRIHVKLISSRSSPRSPISVPLLQTKIPASAGGKWSFLRFAGAVLFCVNAAIGYLLMLAVMSFNGGVFVAVVVGLGFGYFLFRSGADDEIVEPVIENSCACA
ncbi:hypothetical protein LguiA_017861 [Lonicera macranthoides]